MTINYGSCQERQHLQTLPYHPIINPVSKEMWDYMSKLAFLNQIETKYVSHSPILYIESLGRDEISYFKICFGKNNTGTLTTLPHFATVHKD